MNAVALLVPRPQSRAAASERTEEEAFEILVASIETLLFTSVDRPEALDRAVLGAALAELEARWPTGQPPLTVSAGSAATSAPARASSHSTSSSAVSGGEK